MNRWHIAMCAAAGSVLLAAAGCTAGRLETARQLARASEPFNINPVGANARMLVLGDSTGVGTGAASPANSVAGRIARDHPRLAIVNRAEDGARFHEVSRQLQGDPSGRFDAILILAGGNDVIRFTNDDTLRAEISSVLAHAQTQAPIVFIMPSGNVGNAPFFLPPLSWLMTARSRALHSIIRDAAAGTKVVTIDLFRERADDPFVRDPQRLHAVDGLHPSDEGYAIWYDDLRRQGGLAERLP